MNIAKMMALVAACLISCGCVHSISPSELTAMLKEREMVPVDFWWYTGSDQNYHYFKNHLLVGTKTYRVPRQGIVIRETFERTSDKSRWFPFHSLSELEHPVERKPQPPPGN